MKTQKKLFFLSALSILIFVALLLDILYKGYLTDLDKYVNSMIAPKNNFLINLSKIFNYLFDIVSIIAISLIISIYLWFRDSKKDSIFFTSVILINSLLIFLTKELIQRERPLNSIIEETGFSFPSGHAAITVGFFGFITYLIFIRNKSKLIKILALGTSIFAIILVSFTRLYLRVHWLTDVLAGIALGSLILFTSILLREKFKD